MSPAERRNELRKTIDPKTADGRLCLNIMAAVDQFERESATDRWIALVDGLMAEGLSLDEIRQRMAAK